MSEHDQNNQANDDAQDRKSQEPEIMDNMTITQLNKDEAKNMVPENLEMEEFVSRQFEKQIRKVAGNAIYQQYLLLTRDDVNLGTYLAGLLEFQPVYKMNFVTLLVENF